MKILFVCRANVGRSQIAEAFFNRLSKKNTGFSAGTHAGIYQGKPVKEFDPVMRCMAELGYDLSEKVSKQITPKMAKEADKIIVLNDKADMPSYVELSKVELWDVEDGKDRSYEFHCRMRDKIKVLVEELVREIG
jgi:protein-tyrosine-phosphatase